MKVLVGRPRREVTVQGPKKVKDLLRELAVVPESVLIIRGTELLTGSDQIADDETVELRPVISGG